MVFSFVGDQPPTSLDDWTLEGQTTRTEIDITFGRDGDIERGTQVWVTAYWYNPRGAAEVHVCAMPSTLVRERECAHGGIESQAHLPVAASRNAALPTTSTETDGV